MKKIYIFYVLILTVIFSTSTFALEKMIENAGDNQTEIHEEQWFLERGYTPIRTFVDLAKIGRVDEGHQDFDKFNPHEGSKFFLANDIELPFVGMIDSDIDDQENSLEYELRQYIPDYFMQRATTSGSIASSKIRGWDAVPLFSGIFDGNGHTICGLAGNRLAANRNGGTANPNLTESGQRMLTGLFGVVTGQIRNLTVEIGQEVPEDFPTTAALRLGVRHLSGYGQDESMEKNVIQGTGFDTGYNLPPEQGGHRIMYGATGTIAAYLRGGIIENSFVRSRTLDNALQSYQMNLGGLVGILDNGGQIINSASEVAINGTSSSGTVGSQTRASNVGGFVGLLDRGTITASYAKGSITWGNRYVGGLIGTINSNDVIIENSYSGTEIINLLDSRNYGAAGFVHTINQGIGTAQIKNSFTYSTYTKTAGSNNPPATFSGFIYAGANIADVTNVFTTSLDVHGVAFQLSEEQLRNPHIVNNFLNREETIFHIDPTDNNEIVFSTHNNNPQPIAKVRVNASESSIQRVEGIIAPLDTNGDLFLTAGEFTITLAHGVQSRDYRLVVTGDEVTLQIEIFIWSVTFLNENNDFHNMAFFREEESLESVNPPMVGKVFEGWFTEQHAGQQVLTASAEHIIVWAHFYDFAISGVTNAGAQLTLRSLDDAESEPLTIIANTGTGIFNFTNNILAGKFNLEITLNGFLTHSQLVFVDQPLTNLSNLSLSPVEVYGTSLSFTSIAIIDEFGNTVEAIENTFSTGKFFILRLLDGQYSIRIQREGFVVFDRAFTVDRQSINLNDLFEEDEIIQLNPVTISGTAKEGTAISLYENDLLIETYLVGLNRTFEFSAILNVAIFNSNYTIVANLERFNAQSVEIEIRGNASAEHNFIQEEQLSIRGISSQRTTVTLLNGKKVVAQTQTDGFGVFEFVGIGNGIFSLIFERANFGTVIQNLTVNYVSIDLDKILLQRTAPENSFVGYILQIILVTTIFASIWVVVYKKDKRKTIKNNS